MYEQLPGGEIPGRGLDDLHAGRNSIEALLVRVAAPRLSRCGIPIPPTGASPALPEHELFRQVSAGHGPEAYRRYGSPLRRLVSLKCALEARR